MDSYYKPIIYYQEDKKQYRKRVTFDQVMSILILVIWLFLFFFLIQFQMHLLYGDVLIAIIFTFSLLIPANIYQLLYAFSYRKLIIKGDEIFPPKVPFRFINRKNEYKIHYKDITCYEVPIVPKGKHEGVSIKHPDYRYGIHIYTTQFPKDAVVAAITQLRENISEKEIK